MNKWRWEPEDIAICLRCDEPWIDIDTKARKAGPLCGCVDQVVKVQVHGGVTYLKFARWPGFFDARVFAKIERLSPQEYREFIDVLADDEVRKVQR
ncbi:hypothetical protein [Novosphingobium sp. KN65.2]|uniref:hypothetical protein n=1 Tax=Novosphingobium sp. KN65.2 TaxID=1478134 RepID=UPI0005EA3847|nr:hypothetical protein [Novosphingobium sp. KN65.2]CDO37620.1 hypothetical protein SPHV1_370007 [Novosphingobium sp. KN65.2]